MKRRDDDQSETNKKLAKPSDSESTTASDCSNVSLTPGMEQPYTSATWRRLALLSVVLSLALFIISIFMTLPSIPEMVSDKFFDGDRSRASYFIGVLGGLTAAIEFVSNPFLGNLSDAVGRKKVVVAVLFGTLIELTMVAYSFTAAVLVVAKILSSFTAALFSVSFAMISDLSRGDTPDVGVHVHTVGKGGGSAGASEGERVSQRTSANFGLVGVAFGIGAVLGPMGGSILSKVGGDKAPFYGAALVGGFNLVLSTLVVRETLPPSLRRSNHTCNSYNPLRSFATLTSSKLIMVLSLVLFLEGISMASYSTFFLHNAERYGWGAFENGLFLGYVGVIAVLMQGLGVRFMVPVVGEARAILFGTGSLALQMFFLAFSSEGWMLYLSVTLTAGAHLTMPCLRSLVSQQVAKNASGNLMGALSALGTVNKLLGQVMANSVFGFFISSQAPMRFVGAAFFASGVIMVAAFTVALSVSPILAQSKTAGSSGSDAQGIDMIEWRPIASDSVSA